MFESLSSFVATYVPITHVTLPMFGVVDVHKLIVAVAVFLVLSALFWFLRMILLVRLETLAGRTVRKFDDTVVEAIRSIRPWVYVLVSLYAALSLYEMPDTFGRVVTGALLLAFVWQAIQVVRCFISYTVTNYLEKDEDGDGEVDPASATMSHLVTLIAQILLWVVGIIFVLSNIGVEVTSLIAGLGIGGIAVAFALQGVLSDLFASFSIYFDKPFRIGDFIVVGSDSGTVENIGVKSTRLRTLQGEELVISNAELTTARVQNFKKMNERRVSSEVGITYETPQERVREVNGIVERIFADMEGVRFDRTHLKSFGDSALIFEIVYHVETSNYAEFMDVQQQFNFTLMERFAEVGIEFAYPTQTIYHKAA